MTPPGKRQGGRPLVWFTDCVDLEEPDENCLCDYCKARLALQDQKKRDREQEELRQERLRRRF